MSKGTKASTGTAKVASTSKRDKMPQDRVGDLAMYREGDDMHIVLPGLFAVGGTPSEPRKATGKGAFILASTPGQTSWLPYGQDEVTTHPSGHRLGIKVTAMLAGDPEAVLEAKAGKDKEAPATKMARPSFGKPA